MRLAPVARRIAELLISKGVNVIAKNDDGETPLDWAEEVEHTETVDLLRKHGGKTGEELKAEREMKTPPTHNNRRCAIITRINSNATKEYFVP